MLTMKYLTSREACRILSIHPNTLRRYANNGTIESFKTESGQRRYHVEAYLGLQKQSVTICYGRVSSPKQRDDLGRQVEFMQSRYPRAEVVKDLVRFLNYKRKGLKSILERAMRGDKLETVVAHKDRLARFGFELISFLIQLHFGKIVVLKQTHLEPKLELTTDLLSIRNKFSCFIPGLRNYKSQVRQALSEPETKKDVQEVA